MDQQQALQRIIDVYFREHTRRTEIPAGTQVLEVACYNDRLFWVRKGQLTGYIHNETSNMSAEVFRISKGMFFGVHSFFARTLAASTTVITEQHSELAWIDLTTEAVEPEKYGSLSEQFMPVIVHELGQLAAGIAHELNNAIGVLSSKTECMQRNLFELLEEVKPVMSPFFGYWLV